MLRYFFAVKCHRPARLTTAPVIVAALAALLLWCLACTPTVQAAEAEAAPGWEGCPVERAEEELPAGIAARVFLYSEPIVSGPEILLGDVACIVGEADTVQRLEVLSVGAAPLVGSTREFATGTLNLRMRQGGIDDKTVEIVGPSSFTVRRGAAILSGSMLQELVTEAILQTLPEGAELDLVFQPVADLAVPEGDVQIEPARLPQRWAGPVSIGLNVLVNGKLWKSLTLRADASLMQPVWVSTETILKGELIGPHNAELRLVEVDGTLQPADLSGDKPLRANRVIQPKRIVEARFVEVQPDAPRGQPVHVTLTKAGLQLQALGTLMGDAMIGEVVTVRNVDSGRTFVGRLVSEDRVVVEMP